MKESDEENEKIPRVLLDYYTNDNGTAAIDSTG